MKKLYNILIVEDEILVLDALVEALESSGFTTYKAGDGKQGLKIINEQSLDFVVLDLAMPSMNGIQMLKSLRSGNHNNTIPVLVLTNLEPDENILKDILENQVSGYLIKSDLTPSNVVSRIKEILNSS